MAKAYVLPFVAYLLGTALIGRFPVDWYPLCYGLIVGIVGAIAVWQLRGRQILRPHWRIGHALWIGLVGIGLWIVLSQFQRQLLAADFLPSWLTPADRVGYDPFEQLPGLWAVALFVTVRTIGLAVVVPVAEELFWRGFLLRWTIDPEWERVPLGEYTLTSCLLVTAMFTLAHPEWLAAAVYCLLLNGLLYWKRDLWLCVVAHGVSNFSLAAYVLWYRAWWLW